MFSGRAFVVISVGSPHVRCTPVGHACGEPNEIKLTAAHGLYHRPFPGCAGFVINGNDCDTVSSQGVASSSPAYGQILSYSRRQTQEQPRTRAGRTTPPPPQPKAGIPAVGSTAGTAKAAVDATAKAAVPLEWWVAPPTEHVFPQDRAWMTEWCTTPPSRTMQWAGAPGTHSLLLGIALHGSCRLVFTCS